MKFFRKHSYDIVKLLLNQFGIAFLGFMLLNATRLANDSEYSVLTLISAVFSTLLYLYLIYGMMQDLGAHARVKVESGKEERHPLDGFKMMVWSQALNFILLIVMGIGLALMQLPAAEHTGAVMYSVPRLIFMFLFSMYQGIIGFFVGDGVYYLAEFLALVAATVPAVLVGTFSYILGLNGKKLLPTGYEPKKKKD